MRTHFIEVSNGFNHGKFMLARISAEEGETHSALPGYEHESLWTVGGRRKFGPGDTLVVDLQTGEGASFRPGMGSARADLDKRKVWVCPLFEPFLCWLYEQDTTILSDLPRYVELGAPGAFAGYRREGHG